MDIVWKPTAPVRHERLPCPDESRLSAMKPEAPKASSGKAGRREWVGLAVLALPCVLYAMDLTVLNLAIPSLTTDLKPTAAQLLWIVDIYGFLAAGALLIMGALGD